MSESYKIDMKLASDAINISFFLSFFVFPVIESHKLRNTQSVWKELSNKVS